MKIYNDETRKKEEFTPLEDGAIRMYVCGPTVYNYIHIGNARPLIVFDALRCYLEYKGYKVTFVQNFTDIDDKMINRAAAEKTTVKALAGKYIGEYFVDSKGLGVREATIHPKATENMEAIIALIKTLVDKGYAYAADGDVYFRTNRFKDYGKLSHMPIEDLEAGIRVEPGEHKENPMDFALWKAYKEGEPFWESPWGNGRPGWHIECSAMANKYLGKTIDIHGGGQDLTFPHHENEIAQSEAANDAIFSRYWVHNAYINVDNRKMSKSLGNFFTVREIAEKYGYEPIRFFMLSAHYRSPVNFSAETLEQSKAALDRLYNCLNNIEFLLKNAKDEEMSNLEKAAMEKLVGYEKNYMASLDDDFNTADAIAALFDITREINSAANTENKPSKEFLDSAKTLFNKLCGILNLCQNQADKSVDDEVKALIEKRQAARASRDFKTADAIRDELAAKGIMLEDTPQGVKVTMIKKD
ncbi:MAG: cysteine--tRNA ligase [Bacillota bacterium]|nr:cysteine--tRNA ligase [Bacillota bacterium]